MSIKTLQFCEPFYTIKAVSDENQYAIGRKSIVVNLGERNIMIKDMPLFRLKSTIVTNVMVRDLQRALVIEDYEIVGDLPGLFARMKKQWRMMYDLTGQERHKGVRFWRSSKQKIFNAEVNLCCIDALVDTGLHREHSIPFREVHTQLLGYGKMQKFEDNDPLTLYQEVILAPGLTHDPFYNDQDAYPWHQYQSISDAVFMAIEIS